MRAVKVDGKEAAITSNGTTVDLNLAAETTVNLEIELK